MGDLITHGTLSLRMMHSLAQYIRTSSLGPSLSVSRVNLCSCLLTEEQPLLYPELHYY